MLAMRKKTSFLSRWKTVFFPIFIAMIPFILWDAAVTGRHWWFNERFTLSIRIAGLPLEEWFFFITVPFACLFIWVNLRNYISSYRFKSLSYLQTAFFLFLPAGIFFILQGLEYTGLMMIAFGMVSLLDRLLKTNLLQLPETYGLLAIVAGLTFIFNGYLTARPVVLYDESYQLGIRLGTIPLEDFGYGMALILLNIILYEKFSEHVNG